MMGEEFPAGMRSTGCVPVRLPRSWSLVSALATLGQAQGGELGLQQSPHSGHQKAEPLILGKKIIIPN